MKEADVNKDGKISYNGKLRGVVDVCHFNWLDLT